MRVSLAVVVFALLLVGRAEGGPIPADRALAGHQQVRVQSAGGSGARRPDPRAVDPPRAGWRPRPGWNRDRPTTEAPEAGTLVLVGLGLLVLPVLVRRRRAARR